RPGRGSEYRRPAHGRRQEEEPITKVDAVWNLLSTVILSEMVSRRAFLVSVAAAPLSSQTPEPIIDIHQHTNYTGRSDEELIRHQREMGVAKTVLLPAGSKYGLAAGCGGNDTVVALARRLPKEYVYFANELPDIPETRPVIERFLKGGAIGI